MSVQTAIAGGCPQEVLVLRTARRKKPVEESFGERLARPRNTRLWSKLREIEKLPASDRRAVIKLVDGLISRQKLNSRRARG